MGELLQACVSLANLPYTILLGLVLLYWVSVIVGVFDLDSGTPDMDADADLDMDADADVDMDADARSAVLVPLYQDHAGRVRVVLTKRPDTMRTHPGDVVFPGGRIEPGESPIDAAIREAWEEVALPPEFVEVIENSD